MAQEKTNMTKKTTQADLYRRILAAMPGDPEVVELCRKHIDRAEALSGRTSDSLAAVSRHMATRFYDDGHAVTAKDLAASLSAALGEDWTCRKASYYASRLAKEGQVERIAEKGKPNRYYHL